MLPCNQLLVKESTLMFFLLCNLKTNQLYALLAPWAYDSALHPRPLRPTAACLHVDVAVGHLRPTAAIRAVLLSGQTLTLLDMPSVTLCAFFSNKQIGVSTLLLSSPAINMHPVGMGNQPSASKRAGASQVPDRGTVSSGRKTV